MCVAIKCGKKIYSLLCLVSVFQFNARSTGCSEMYRKMTFSMLLVSQFEQTLDTLCAILPRINRSRGFQLCVCCCCNICTNRNDSMYLLVELCTSVTLSQHTAYKTQFISVAGHTMFIILSVYCRRLLAWCVCVSVLLFCCFSFHLVFALAKL